MEKDSCLILDMEKIVGWLQTGGECRYVYYTLICTVQYQAIGKSGVYSELFFSPLFSLFLPPLCFYIVLYIYLYFCIPSLLLFMLRCSTSNVGRILTFFFFFFLFSFFFS